MNITGYENITYHLIMVVIDALVAVIIFVITAKIASVRVRPHSNENLKQGIVGSAGILIGGAFLYGILFHINELENSVQHQKNAREF